MKNRWNRSAEHLDATDFAMMTGAVFAGWMLFGAAVTGVDRLVKRHQRKTMWRQLERELDHEFGTRR